jgi:hypothetical protein
MSLRTVVAVAELVGADELAEPPSVEPRPEDRTVPVKLERNCFIARVPKSRGNMAAALTESVAAGDLSPPQISV